MSGYNAYETSYTSYGAGGGAGGGGFIPGDGSQQSPGGRDKQQQDSLRPVTIKQILDAQPDAGNDTFRIDGNPVSQVRHPDSHSRYKLICLAADLRWPNPQHFDPDDQYDVQTRRWHR